MALAGFSAVVPDRPYPLPAVAELFGVSTRTVRRWVKGGQLTPLARPAGHRQTWVLGSEILARWGVTAGMVGVPHETEAGRERRARAEWAEARRLAKGRPGGSAGHR